MRHQYHHAVDIVPTILECCGVEFPDYMLGYEQTPLPGVSMRYSFDQADAPTAKKVQYYAMLGTRGLWSEGWKVVAERGPMIGTGDFENDTWQLFHTDTDRSEAHDLADQHPDKVRQLVDLWYAEAGKYNVLPLDDRTLERTNSALVGRPDLMAGRTSLTVYDGMIGMTENVFIDVRCEPVTRPCSPRR